MSPVNNTTAAMNEAESGFDNSDIYSNVDETMTFENLDSEDSDEPISSEEDEESDSEDDDSDSDSDDGDDDSEEKLGSEELKLLNDSDGKSKKEPKKEKELDEEKDEETEEEETEEQEEKPDAKVDAKKLRLKIGDEYHSVESNATVKVKIDGKNTEVPMQELINNYSGKVAYDKKFTEVGELKKQNLQREQLLKTRETQIDSLLSPIVKTMKDPLKDPTEALIFLAEKLDKTGELAATIEKRMLEANLERLVELSTMTEAEQEAHLIKKQNERLLNANEKRKLEESEISKSNQLRSHVDKIREAYGVTVDQYSEAFDELKSLLPGSSLTHEHIADWASQKPHHSTVQQILAPYQDDLDETDYSGIVADFSRSLRDGKLTKEQIQKIVKSEYGVPPVVKKLNNKLNIGKKTGKVPPKKDSDEQDRIESFDDLDD
jgi:hypothetical protein